MRKLLGALTLATFLCVSGAAYAQDTAKQDTTKKEEMKDKKKDKKKDKTKDKKKKEEKKDEKKDKPS
jgi:pentapeptide MXKDX repeat protein